MFSDEKKFNLDGPDGFAYYWHDIRKEERYFSKRQQGGGSVMDWAAISYYGLSSMVVLNGTLKSEDYCDVLSGLLPLAEEDCPDDWIFQFDNARIHTSRYTREWLADNNIDVLLWPSKSPDLNIRTCGGY